MRRAKEPVLCRGHPTHQTAKCHCALRRDQRPAELRNSGKSPPGIALLMGLCKNYVVVCKGRVFGVSECATPVRSEFNRPAGGGKLSEKGGC